MTLTNLKPWVFAVYCILQFLSPLLAQSLHINEFMSYNQFTIADQDDEFHDWIELYNPGPGTVSLAGLYLTDDPLILDQWELPDTTLLAGDFLLIFASAKNIKTGPEYHTNFKLSSIGEVIVLSNALGTVIDRTDSVVLYMDESYGSLPDGSEVHGLVPVPTPGFSNETFNTISVSTPSGFYDTSFSFYLAPYLFPDSIFYTLDGSVPTHKSIPYTKAIEVQDPSGNPNYLSSIRSSPSQTYFPIDPVEKVNVIRFATFRNGVRSSRILSRTFFVGPNVRKRFPYPVLSLMGEPDDFFDHDRGLYVPGVHFEEENPIWTGNYFQTGKEWERPVYLDYFEKEGEHILSQWAGARMHGDKTREKPQKSIRLYARKEYGDQYFRHQVFPQRTDSLFKRMVLRTPMAAWGEVAITDILAREIVRPLGLEAQEYQPAIVFLNGEYWGIHTLRERMDERYFQRRFRLDPGEVDVVLNNTHANMGDNTDWLALKAFVETHDLTEDSVYAEIKRRIDIQNFIDYMIAEIYLANSDWPANNHRFWKAKKDKEKWRWLFYDLDAAFGNPLYNSLVPAIEDKYEWSAKSTFMLRNLLRNPSFNARFLGRFEYLLETVFHPDSTLPILNRLESLYALEMQHQSARWGVPSSTAVWKSAVNHRIRTFLTDRPCAMRDLIVEYFDQKNFAEPCQPTFYSEMHLFPNPSTGQFTLIDRSSANLVGSLTVFNPLGQVLHQRSFDSPTHQQTFVFENLSDGMYIARVEVNGGIRNFRLVIRGE